MKEQGKDSELSETPDKPADQAPTTGKSHEEWWQQIERREVSEKELKQILDAHQKWLDPEAEDGVKADLRGANLPTPDCLTGADLRKATLLGADLRKTWLGGTKTNLENADLRAAKLGGAILTRTNLRGADLYCADLRKATLLEADLKGAHLSQANLQKANLESAKLEKATLEGANLNRAKLFNACLDEANLKDANLEDADLGGAHLARAYLENATVQGANFGRANLQDAVLVGVKGLGEASLQDANLRGATGLLGTEFARQDITGTRLPDDIHKFKALQAVEETSKNARKIFLSMLLACVYSWLTIATTTDARLLTNSASSPLPIIGTEIPIAYFYWAAPFILVALYVYLHFYLQRLWKGLAGLPAIFPDGKSLDERAYPWLLNGLVRRHFERLKKGRPLIAHLEEWATILLAWWVVPLTLVGFWLEYLPRHEWVGTWIHVGLIVASVAAAIIFYRSAGRTLRGHKRQPFAWTRAWQDRRSYQSACVVLIGTIFFFLSSLAIDSPLWPTDPRPSGLRFEIFIRLQTHINADLRGADVSIKPTTWTGQEIALVEGAPLKDKNLRYAKATRAFLVKADLRGADLRRAFLDEADLRKADLTLSLPDTPVARYARISAPLTDPGILSLPGPSPNATNLEETFLQSAMLQEAQLVGANLQKARLTGAELEQADLRGAYLRDATLINANLKGADLTGANLQGADLTGATGLTKGQIQKAKNWVLARFDDDFLKELGIPSNDQRLKKHDLRRMDLWGQDLRGANLGGFNLFQAHLHNAKLSIANLQKADLSFANLQKADLNNANLQEANLNGAQLQGANLIGANLQGANLIGANLQNALLFYADLRRANLQEAEGVTASEFDNARNWQLAFYSDEFLKELGLPSDHNETVKKKLAEMEKEKEKTAISP